MIHLGLLFNATASMTNLSDEEHTHLTCRRHDGQPHWRVAAIYTDMVSTELLRIGVFYFRKKRFLPLESRDSEL